MTNSIYMNKELIGSLNNFTLSQENVYNDVNSLYNEYTQKVFIKSLRKIEGTMHPVKVFMEKINSNQVLGIEHNFEILLNNEPLKYVFSGFFEKLSVTSQPSSMYINFIIQLLSELQMLDLTNEQTFLLPVENLVKKKQEEELEKLKSMINEKVGDIFDGLKDKMLDSITLDSLSEETKETEEDKKKRKGRSIIL